MEAHIQLDYIFFGISFHSKDSEIVYVQTFLSLTTFCTLRGFFFPTKKDYPIVHITKAP